MKGIEQKRGFCTWCRLKRLVAGQPQIVLAQGRAALEQADSALRPRLLAVLGTAMRLTTDRTGAAVILEQAETEAKDIRDDWALADIWQRRAALHMDRAEFEQALEFAQRAAGLYGSLRNDACVGRATYDQGVYLAHLQRHNAARDMFRRALRILPPSEKDNRFSALVGLSRSCAESGDLPKALRWATAATRHREGVSMVLLVGSLQTRGLLAFELGRLDEAVDAFRECVDFYLERGIYWYCAWSTIWLCKVLVDNGQHHEAAVRARNSLDLIGHLRGERIAANAMLILVNHARAERELTIEFLDDILSEFERSKRRGAHKKRAPRTNC